MKYEFKFNCPKCDHKQEIYTTRETFKCIECKSVYSSKDQYKNE